MLIRVFATSLLFCAAAGLPAYGWGKEGHRIIAEIAERHLKPGTRQAVASLLQPGETLQSIASWADDIRPQRQATSTWHYINIPIQTPKGDYRPFCPATGCVVGIIDEMKGRLKNSALSREERAEALKFLVHFVGDMHQPLHCGDNKDRGGNDVKVVFRNQASNLHSIWDTSLLMLLLERRPDMKAKLGKGPGYWARQSMHKGTTTDWVWESQGWSRDIAYANLPSSSPAVLGDDYWTKSVPVIEKQLQRGGIRLADLLNEALGQ